MTHLTFTGYMLTPNASVQQNPDDCLNTEPHLPHELGEYTSEQYGRLQVFCRGCAGGSVQFRILHNYRGGYYYPSYLEVEVP